MFDTTKKDTAAGICLPFRGQAQLPGRQDANTAEKNGQAIKNKGKTNEGTTAEWSEKKKKDGGRQRDNDAIG